MDLKKLLVQIPHIRMESSILLNDRLENEFNTKHNHNAVIAHSKVIDL